MSLFRILTFYTIIFSIFSCTNNDSSTEPFDTILPKITWGKSGLDSMDVKNLSAGDNGDIFAATGRGIFKTSNHGASWELAGLPDTTINSIYYYSPANAIYAGTAYHGVYLSMNNGYTWRQIGLKNMTINVLYLIYGNVIVSTSDSGIYISTNTWSLNSSIIWQRANTGLPISQPIFTFFNADPLLAGSYGVYSSNDGGYTWTLTSANIGNAPVHAFAKMAGFTIVGTDNFGIFRSSNNTTDWLSLNSNLSNTKVLTLCFSGNALLFAGTSTNGVFRSTDMGISWVQVSASLTNMHVQSLYNDYGYLFAATTSGVFKSTLVDNKLEPF